MAFNCEKPTLVNSSQILSGILFLKNSWKLPLKILFVITKIKVEIDSIKDYKVFKELIEV